MSSITLNNDTSCDSIHFLLASIDATKLALYSFNNNKTLPEGGVLKKWTTLDINHNDIVFSCHYYTKQMTSRNMSSRQNNGAPLFTQKYYIVGRLFYDEIKYPKIPQGYFFALHV